MNDQVKRRSNAVLASLAESANTVEALADELVRMIIRGDDDRRVPIVLHAAVEKIRDAVNDIKNCVYDISTYVNRKQATHRL